MTIRIHYRTCPLCEAMCGLEIELDADRIVAIRGDAADPFSRGHVCPKGVALDRIHTDPDRLRKPLIREGEDWREAEWAEALDFAADGLRRLQKRHGHDSVAVYLGNPNVHNTGSMLMMPNLVRALQTRQRYSATSADQLPHMFAAWAMFGHQLLMPVPDLDRTDLFVVFGGNPAASNGSIMTAPDFRNRLRALHERGGHSIVLDPRRTETAELAREFHFVRPESDVFVLAAIVQTLFRNGWIRTGRLGKILDGTMALQQATARFSPELAAEQSGLDAAWIEALARKLFETPRAVVYGRLGVSTQRHGALCQWLINAINILTGHFDEAGGAMFATPAIDPVTAPGAFATGRGSFGRWRSRVRDLPEVHGELPVAALAEEMTVPGDDRVRGFVCIAGNPVLSTPGGHLLDAALAELDFMVSIDFYLNETSRHANVILPPVPPLERSHYDLAFHLLAIRNTAKYSPAAIPSDGLSDWDIALELIDRLQPRRKMGVAQKLTHVVLRRSGPELLLELALLAGPYGLRALQRGRLPLTLKTLRQYPHGIDLGPLRPALPERLQTKDKRIELAPTLLLEAIAKLEPDASSGDPDVLMLIGRRHLRNNNSWLHNIGPLMTGRRRDTLWMHPDDAKRRGIKDGDTVQVVSDAGNVSIAVTVTEKVMPGVVSLPHGFGHDRPGIRLSTAARHAGASINDLTDPNRVDPVCGNAAFNGTPVRVTPV
ncbi:MAG: molybdopterin oxidoreductase family protein [Candidatus Dadabacteria bacterium]|nr:MAG: molybdopterin oxidoreductase family protein [Candidatus Dadabacteria bacterium]